MTIGRIALIAVIVLSLAPPAYADFPRDWYVSAGVGWGYADSVTFDEHDALLEIDRGIYLPSGALGVKLGDYRVELEGSQRHNTPEILYAPDAGIEIDPDGRDELNADSLLLNVVRDIPVGIAWRPYVGAGIGVAKVDYRLSEIEIPNLDRPRRDIVNDESTTFAFQLIAGFTVPVTRRFDLAADYRYWKAPSPDLEDVSGTALDIDHTVHSVWLNLRYHAPDAGVFRKPPPRKKPQRGWYLKSSIGGGFSEDSDVDIVPPVTIDAFDIGLTTTVGLGYAWRKRWRFELEGAYRRNDVEVIDFRAAGEDAASGDVKAYSLMANAIVQFAPGSSIRPFFGAGFGVVHSKFDIDVRGICTSFVCGTTERHAKLIDDDDNAYAAQIFAGVDVAVTPRMTFTADYRYWRTRDFKMEQPDGAPFENYLRNTSITVGFRYSLADEH